MRCLVALGLFVGLAACSRSSHSTCQDADRDGYGVGCAKGLDCDDSDPTRASECGDAGAVECDDENAVPGCPCLGEGSDSCYSGATDTIGVGLCQVGRTQCSDNVWSSCEGAVLPSFETCNGLDDDCDGLIDEGVQSPCGGCNAACTGGVWGTLSAPFMAGGDLDVTASGELTLRNRETSALTVWVPNTDEGTVSKIDASSATEVARYRTRGGSPIRIAVDRRGDAFVLDGSLTGQAHLSKIAGSIERCVDHNGDGLKTSTGPDDVRALGDDECMLMELPLGAAGEDARSLALDGAVAPDTDRAGNAWVGFSGAERLVSFDGTNGAQLSSLDLPDFHPYASAFDAWGTLWLLDRDGYLASVDPIQQPMAATIHSVPFACYALEGLSIDGQERLLLTGFGCESVLTYDPQRDAWRHAQVGALQSPRGVMSLPAAGWISYDSGDIARVTEDPLAVGDALSLAQADAMPYETVALSADSLGQLWAISTQGGVDSHGVATRFDPDTSRITAEVTVGVGPRGGGDLSGMAFAANFAPEGEASHVFTGCSDDHDGGVGNALTEWLNLHVESVIGAGGSLEVAVRRADQEVQLMAADFQIVGTLPKDSMPFPLSLPPGGAVEVRLVLRASGALGAPRVARVGLEWRCPGPS